MWSRIRAALLLVPVALVTLIAGSVPTANAAVIVPVTSCTKFTSGTVMVPAPFLQTIYGPISHGTRVSGPHVNQIAEAGLFSSVANSFNPTGISTSSYSESFKLETNFGSSDGVVGLFCGYRKLETSYGPVVFGIQYSMSNPTGRFGNVNLLANRFFPDGGGWLPLA
ncbi:hypothetical protein FrEUN1fDRAFT_1736 [Parafrankia sp. EUN1f]|nr:hypothetical protein FrEUN1fDRAFT_1736 [Parafrankia sp. EUN1f]